MPEPRIVATSVRRFTEAELRALMWLPYPPAAGGYERRASGRDGGCDRDA